MKAVAVKRNQVGAVLSLELGILMAVVASIAIGFGIILGGKLPVFFDHILDQALYGAEATLLSNEQAACNLVDDNRLGQGDGNLRAYPLKKVPINNYNNPVCQDF